MVADALHEVAGEFGIEKAEGQAHQFVEEIGDQPDADPRADVAFSYQRPSLLSRYSAIFSTFPSFNKTLPSLSIKIL